MDRALILFVVVQEAIRYLAPLHLLEAVALDQTGRELATD
jgi:hypothetical protein